MVSFQNIPEQKQIKIDANAKRQYFHFINLYMS